LSRQKKPFIIKPAFIHGRGEKLDEISSLCREDSKLIKKKLFGEGNGP
jgi:hypothetical protein